MGWIGVAKAARQIDEREYEVWCFECREGNIIRSKNDGQGKLIELLGVLQKLCGCGVVVHRGQKTRVRVSVSVSVSVRVRMRVSLLIFVRSFLGRAPFSFSFGVPSFCLCSAPLLALVPALPGPQVAPCSPEFAGARIGSSCSPTEIERGTARFDWEGCPAALEDSED